jgi:hypothetical protein
MSAKRKTGRNRKQETAMGLGVREERTTRSRRSAATAKIQKGCKRSLELPRFNIASV